MIISAINNNFNTKTSFQGDDNPSKELKKLKKDVKQGVKSNVSAEKIKGFEATFDKIVKPAEDEIKKLLDGKGIKIPKVFSLIVKYCGKIDKTGNKALDTASMLTKVVLWGNVGKEAVGTTLYTVQALTNQDLPEDKRKFVGMYDLSVGLVSTAFSFIFGVGLENKVKEGYKNILKPLSNSKDTAVKSKAAAAIVGLAAFSSFFLQTIIGKRIIAPAIGTPAAGKLRTYMEEKEAAKKKGAKKPEDNMPSIPVEALVLAKAPTESKADNFKLIGQA